MLVIQGSAAVEHEVRAVQACSEGWVSASHPGASQGPGGHTASDRLQRPQRLQEGLV